MRWRACRDVPEAAKTKLVAQIARLTLLEERAASGDRCRYRRQLRGPQQQQMARGGCGLRKRLKIDFSGIADELASGFNRWAERLDDKEWPVRAHRRSGR